MINLSQIIRSAKLAIFAASILTSIQCGTPLKLKQPATTTPATLKVYLGGFSEVKDDNGRGNVVGQWKDGKWTAYQNIYTNAASGAAQKNADIKAMIKSGTDFYAAGWISDSSSKNHAGYWKNGVWVGLSNGETTDASEVAYPREMTVVGEDVYVIGTCNNAAGDSISGYWKNGAWTRLNNGLAGGSVKDVQIEDILVNGSDVYIVGESQKYVVGGSGDEILLSVPGYWKNGTWVGLVNGITGDNSVSASAYGLAIMGSDIYVVGKSSGSNSDSVVKPGYWKNGTWNSLDLAATASLDTLHEITIFGSDVYITGTLFELEKGEGTEGDGGYDLPGYWKNGTWVGLKNGITGNNLADAKAYSVALDGSDVYVSGYSVPAENPKNKQAGYWKNETWVSVPNGETGDYSKHAEAQFIFLVRD